MVVCGGAETRGCAAVVSATKPVGDELIEVDFFLPHKPRLRQFPGGMHVQYGANSSGCGDLDRTPVFVGNVFVINLPRIGDLYQLPLAHAGDRAKSYYDILKCDRHRLL